MIDIESEEVQMLEELIVSATLGKKIYLNAKVVREVVKAERDSEYMETDILYMEYSGTVNDKPFKFKKSYLFADDASQNALESLLIANNRLHTDYERLKEAGIEIDGEFFNFQNCSMSLPDQVSVKSSAMRLEYFIQLSHLCYSSSYIISTLNSVKINLMRVSSFKLL